MIFRYFFLRYTLTLLATASLLGFVVFAARYASVVARFSDLADVFDLLLLSLAGIPATIDQLLMVVVAVSVVVTMIKFNRSNEWLILRAQGITGIRLLSPILVCTAIVGIIDVTLLSGFAASSSRYYNEKKAEFGSNIHEQFLGDAVRVEPMLEHQNDGSNSYFVQALAEKENGEQLHNVRLFTLNTDFELDRWYKSKVGVRGRTDYGFSEARRQSGAREGLPENLRLPALLGGERESDLDGVSGSVEFWPLLRLFWLADTMRTIDRIQLHEHLSLTFSLLGLVLLIAALLFPKGRVNRYGQKVGIITLVVFFVFLLNRILTGLGEVGLIGTFVSVWLPTILLLSAGAALFLSVEEG